MVINKDTGYAADTTDGGEVIYSQVESSPSTCAIKTLGLEN